MKDSIKIKEIEELINSYLDNKENLSRKERCDALLIMLEKMHSLSKEEYDYIRNTFPEVSTKSNICLRQFAEKPIGISDSEINKKETPDLSYMNDYEYYKRQYLQGLDSAIEYYKDNELARFFLMKQKHEIENGIVGTIQKLKPAQTDEEKKKSEEKFKRLLGIK